MTDPVSGISGVRGTGPNSAKGGEVFKREKGKGYKNVAEDDNVDISKEASDRASGEKHQAGS
jgi:hypothetical protein